jgi:hypothetical protein
VRMMVGYLCNTTDCDHCENEHNKPNKDALNVSVRNIHKDLSGTNAVKELFFNPLGTLALLLPLY